MQSLRPLLTACLLALAGCAVTEEATEMSGSPPLTGPEQTQTPPVAFETRVDTIEARKADDPAHIETEKAETEIHWAVQIGAFKDPRNASIVQSLARERYSVPVLNEFNPDLSLYQIRIGSFATREEARVLLRRMQAEYPGEYKDSWVVQCRR